MGGTLQYVRGNYKSLNGTNLTVVHSKIHPFTHLPGIVYYYKKWKYTPAVRSKISSKLIFASCVFIVVADYLYDNRVCILKSTKACVAWSYYIWLYSCTQRGQQRGDRCVGDATAGRRKADKGYSQRGRAEKSGGRFSSRRERPAVTSRGRALRPNVRTIDRVDWATLGDITAEQ